MLKRDYAWYNQERMRGKLLVSASPQAGWVFNDAYFQRTIIGHNHGDPVYGPRRLYPSEAEAIAPEQLRLRPFFSDFRDAEIYGEEGSTFVRTNAFIRWYALSHGIPAESFAAGANPVPKWDGVNRAERDKESYANIRNINMATKCGRNSTEDNPENWCHSYFIQFSLYNTSKLYKKLVGIINHKPLEVKP